MIDGGAATAGDDEGGAALARLPSGALGVPELDADPAWRLAAAFLVGFRGHTRKGYFNDIHAWYRWCAEVGVHPLEAQRHHIDRWITELSELPQPKTGKPAAASTITRLPPVSTVPSWRSATSACGAATSGIDGTHDSCEKPPPARSRS